MHSGPSWSKKVGFHSITQRPRRGLILREASRAASPSLVLQRTLERLMASWALQKPVLRGRGGSNCAKLPGREGPGQLSGLINSERDFYPLSLHSTFSQAACGAGLRSQSCCRFRDSGTREAMSPHKPATTRPADPPHFPALGGPHA